MKILMLVDWRVARLTADSDALQSPDKLVTACPYWFFKHWPDQRIELDILDIGGAEWLHRLESSMLHFYIIQSLRAYLKRKKYDLIISHGARSALALAFLRSLSKEKNPPHVVIDVGCFNGGRDNRAELYLIRKASSSIRGIIMHSGIQSSYYEAYLPNIPYRFVPFGVDADYFKPTSLPHEDFILSFGSHARDYPTLIEAWRQISAKDTRLKIIGISAIAGMNRLPQHVDLMDRMPVQALARHVAKARFLVFALPYHRYSYGQMSFLQSMSMGKCCIVTRAPSSEDYIRDRNNALFVRPYDAGDLAEKMEMLMHDEQLVADVGKQARRSIVTTFNEREMAVRMHAFITALC